MSQQTGLDAGDLSTAHARMACLIYSISLRRLLAGHDAPPRQPQELSADVSSACDLESLSLSCTVLHPTLRSAPGQNVDVQSTGCLLSRG